MKNDEYKILSRRFDKIGHCGQHTLFVIEKPNGEIIKNVCAECEETINGEKNGKQRYNQC